MPNWKKVIVSGSNAILNTITADGTITANAFSGDGSNLTGMNTNQLTNGAGFTTNTGTVTSVATGTGLTGGTISSTGTISLSHLGLESLTDPNDDRIFFWDDSAGASAFLDIGSGLSISGTTLSNSITNNNQLTNGAGYTTNTGTVTSVGVGTGLDVSNATTTPSITLDLSEFTDMTAAVDTSVDELILLDSGAERRKRFAEIFGTNAYNSTPIPTSLGDLSPGDLQDEFTLSNTNISEFNNDSGFTNNTGTVSSLSDLSITATAAELNKLDGVTATTAELNFVDGVTSNIQTQLNSKAGGDDFDADGTFASLRAQGTTKGDVGLGNVENTALSTYTGNGGALDNQYIANGAGYITSFTNTMGSGFVLEDGDGTEVTITENKEVKFVEAGGININWSDTSNGSDTDPYDLSFSINTGVTAGNGLTGGGTLSSTRTLNVGAGTGVTVNADDISIGQAVGTSDDVEFNNLTLAGDLTVNGTTTTISTTNTVISDNLIELNSGATSNSNDSGIIIERGTTGNNALFIWDESADRFAVGTTTATADSTGNITFSTANLQANTFVGALSGNATTATSAGKWTTARQLTLGGDLSGNVTFDGSANFTLTAAVANDSHTHDSRYYTESEVDTFLSEKDNYGSWTVSDGENSTDIDSGGTLTFSAGSNVGISESAGTITISATDTNTTYSAGSGIGLTGTTFSVAAGTGLSQDASGLSLATAGAGAGTYGSTANGTKIDTITIDAYGRVTAVATGATGTSSTSGTVTSVGTGTGLTGGAITSTGTISLEYEGAGENFIDAATNLEGTSISTGDTIVYHDANDEIVKKGLVSDLPFDNYTKWQLSDGSTNTNVTTGTTVTFSAGDNIEIGNSSNTITISATDTNTTYSAGSLLDLSGTTFNVDLSELTDMTEAWSTSNDEFVVLDSGVQKRKLSSEIFGSNAFNSTTIPTNNNQLTNGAGYITEHPSVSAASSVNNTGRTYIQDVTLDDYGHVTGLTSATETVSNTTYTLTVGADGGNGSNINLNPSTGGTNTVKLEGGDNVLITENTSTDVITIAATTASYSAGTGITLTGTTFSLTTPITNNNQLTNGAGYITDHPSVAAAGSVDNSGRTYIQDIMLDDFGHVTGLTSATETVINTDTNYYLNGITKSSNTLTFSVNGTTNQTYTFGSNAFTSTAIPTSLGDFGQSLSEGFTLSETNISEFNNDAGYVTQDTTYSAGTGLNLNPATTFNVDTNLSTDGVHTIGRDGNDKFVVNTTNHAWYLDGVLDMRLANNGQLDVDGNIVAYSTVTNSDRRLKTDISTIESASEKVSKLRGVEYTWDYGKLKGKRDIGLIAQEVEEVIPEVVTDGELLDGTEAKRVDYGKLVGLLIEANKEQQTQIQSLIKEVEELKGRL
jgi:hypothetical protein